MSSPATLSWLSIVRIGLVQTALGAVVVLCTATINRVMIVELALLAMIPAVLIGLYHGFQLLRPKWGHGADQGRARTPWIIGGMAVLAAGTVGAAAANAWMETAFWPGLFLGVFSFAAVGLGLGASATNLLAMLAAHVAPERKTAAGSLVWILMIAGLAASGITIGQVLDPYSGERLVTVAAAIAVIAILLTVVALIGVERRALDTQPEQPRRQGSFAQAARDVWQDRQARLFTLFVFVAMLAYNTQDLILEPYGGHVFGMTVGQSTALGGTMHAGALIGMIIVFAMGLITGARFTRTFMITGCIGSGICLLALAMGGLSAETWPLTVNVMALGFCNGVFAVAAIGMMMGLASTGTRQGSAAREGTRMGVFGAAQSMGFALGAAFGAAALDVLRSQLPDLAQAYGAVFAFEGVLFLIAAVLARIAAGAVSQQAAQPALSIPAE
ncbi:MAG: BCD family MFS transporter [Pseudomonadota bacterium]